MRGCPKTLVSQTDGDYVTNFVNSGSAAETVSAMLLEAAGGSKGNRPAA
jgi:hypothetical protein